jgi:hypothetical protein
MDLRAIYLRSILRALAEWTGGGRCAFASSEEALDLRFTAVVGKLIVIDEFAYL